MSGVVLWRVSARDCRVVTGIADRWMFEGGNRQFSPSKWLEIHTVRDRVAREAWLVVCMEESVRDFGEETVAHTEMGKKFSWVLGGTVALAIALGAACGASAQNAEQSRPQQQDSQQATPQREGQQANSQQTAGAEQSAQDRGALPAMTQKADGRRRADLPIEAYAVTPGTKFLVQLDEELSTSSTPEKKRFVVRTLEPLEAGSGIYLPAGATITGHVSRVEPAGVTGRARLYLTFDEIHTKFGELPIVAAVDDVPGDRSVKVRPDHEGVVEVRTTTQQAVGQAAAEGAAMGAVRGVKDKNVKEAEEGALAGAIAAYLMESGRGHELDLAKGAKLELELERALYLVKE